MHPQKPAPALSWPTNPGRQPAQLAPIKMFLYCLTSLSSQRGRKNSRCCMVFWKARKKIWITESQFQGSNSTYEKLADRISLFTALLPFLPSFSCPINRRWGLEIITTQRVVKPWKSPFPAVVKFTVHSWKTPGCVLLLLHFFTVRFTTVKTCFDQNPQFSLRVFKPALINLKDSGVNIKFQGYFHKQHHLTFSKVISAE